SSWWHGAVLRGDFDAIVLGRDSNVQDNVVVHVDRGMPATIGARVTVGHAAVVHGCTIEDDCLIGMNATINSGAVIGRGSLVASGAVNRITRATGMRNANASVTTRVPTWIAWLSRPVCAWRNGNRIGTAKPTPPATLPKMNDKAKAAFLCSAVVWSAIIAFHAAKMPPSDT